MTVLVCRTQEITNLVWSYAKIGSPLSEEACALLDMVPNEVLRHLSDESRRVKVRFAPQTYTGSVRHPSNA